MMLTMFMLGNALGEALGAVFGCMITRFRKPMAAGAVYLAGRNHDFLSSLATDLFTYIN